MRPPKIRKGEKIVIVGLASASDTQTLDQTIIRIKNYDYQVEADLTCFLNWNRFSGND